MTTPSHSPSVQRRIPDVDAFIANHDEAESIVREWLSRQEIIGDDGRVDRTMDESDPIRAIVDRREQVWNCFDIVGGGEVAMSAVRSGCPMDAESLRACAAVMLWDMDRRQCQRMEKYMTLAAESPVFEDTKDSIGLAEWRPMWVRDKFEGGDQPVNGHFQPGDVILVNRTAAVADYSSQGRYLAQNPRRNNTAVFGPKGGFEELDLEVTRVGYFAKEGERGPFVQNTSWDQFAKEWRERGVTQGALNLLLRAFIASPQTQASFGLLGYRPVPKNPVMEVDLYPFAAAAFAGGPATGHRPELPMYWADNAVATLRVTDGLRYSDVYRVALKHVPHSHATEGLADGVLAKAIGDQAVAEGLIETGAEVEVSLVHGLSDKPTFGPHAPQQWHTEKQEELARVLPPTLPNWKRARGDDRGHESYSWKGLVTEFFIDPVQAAGGRHIGYRLACFGQPGFGGYCVVDRDGTVANNNGQKPPLFARAQSAAKVARDIVTRNYDQLRTNSPTAAPEALQGRKR